MKLFILVLGILLLSFWLGRFSKKPVEYMLVPISQTGYWVYYKIPDDLKCIKQIKAHLVEKPNGSVEFKEMEIIKEGLLKE